MLADDKHPDPWPAGLQLKSPPYTLTSGMDVPKGTPSSRRLAILTVGAVCVLTISLLGVLLAAYIGRTACIQRDSFSYLPAQVHVQNEASLLLALSDLSEQGAAPGITCDLKNQQSVTQTHDFPQQLGQAPAFVALKTWAPPPKEPRRVTSNQHLMVYHGQPEGCVARKMEPSDQLTSCQELENYFQAILRNVSLGMASDVQIVGASTLGSLVTLLCTNRPMYMVTTLSASPRHPSSMAA